MSPKWAIDIRVSHTQCNTPLLILNTGEESEYSINVEPQIFDSVVVGMPPVPDMESSRLRLKEKNRVYYALASPTNTQSDKSNNITIKCGEYKWNIHGGVIKPMSGLIRSKINADAKVSLMLLPSLQILMANLLLGECR